MSYAESCSGLGKDRSGYGAQEFTQVAEAAGCGTPMLSARTIIGPHEPYTDVNKSKKAPFDGVH